jgi:hypothetical protein
MLEQTRKWILHLIICHVKMEARLLAIALEGTKELSMAT